MKRLVRFLTRIALLVMTVMSFIGAIALNGYIKPREKFVAVEKFIEVVKPEPTYEELEQRAVDKGVPREVVRVLLHQEDRRGPRRDSKKCEFESDDWLKRANAIAKARNLTPDERDAYRCSYGPWQVAGWHVAGRKMKDGRDMTWIDLGDPEVNFDVGSDVWLEARARAVKETSDKRKQYWVSFRNYNGSGPRAEKYANEVFTALVYKVFDEHFSNR